MTSHRFFRYPSRYRLFIFLHCAVLALVPATQAPSDPMGLELLGDAPDAEELVFFEELSTWIREDPAEISTRDAIRDRSSSFDFFRNFHDEAVRYEQMQVVPYGDTIVQTADRYGLDPLLVASVIEAESSFDPAAVSPQGAMGLMQVVPAAHAVSADGLQDPKINIEHGTRYLHALLERFDGDLELALAAYNAGPTNVRRYGGVPPFRETQRYVEKVLELYVEHHRTVWRGSETGEMLATG